VSDVLLYFAILAVGVPALFGVGAVGFARAYCRLSFYKACTSTWRIAKAQSAARPERWTVL